MTDNARTPPAPLPSDEALNEAELAALGEDVDIEADARRKILAVHGQLKDTDHYALLGVERTADIKAIKRADFDAAALFIPIATFENV